MRQSLIALHACQSAAGFGVLGAARLVAPALLWSEFRSAAHQSAWRREIAPARRDLLFKRLASGPVRERRHAQHGAATSQIADDLGWAKTYDAEYVALASLLGCRLVTLDGRLRRGADRLGFVVTPAEL